MKVFIIPSGAKCQVRRKGTDEWANHDTRMQHEYEVASARPAGDFWLVFESGEWEMLIARRRVILREKPNEIRPGWTFNKGKAGGKNGRGASRRKNRRYQKRVN